MGRQIGLWLVPSPAPCIRCTCLLATRPEKKKAKALFAWGDFRRSILAELLSRMKWIHCGLRGITRAVYARSVSSARRGCRRRPALQAFLRTQDPFVATAVQLERLRGLHRVLNLAQRATSRSTAAGAAASVHAPLPVHDPPVVGEVRVDRMPWLLRVLRGSCTARRYGQGRRQHGWRHG